MIDFKGKFEIIPAVKHIKCLEQILSLPNKYIILNDIHIGNLEQIIQKCHSIGKTAIVNMDLVGGLALDKVGIEMLKHLYKVDVVEGSSVAKLNMAKSIGLDVVFRIALMDSRYLDTALKVLEICKCDMIEIRPAEYGLRFADEIRKVKDVPLILGGFVDDEKIVKRAYEAGFQAIDTSTASLWNMDVGKWYDNA